MKGLLYGETANNREEGINQGLIKELNDLEFYVFKKPLITSIIKNYKWLSYGTPLWNLQTLYFKNLPKKKQKWQ